MKQVQSGYACCSELASVQYTAGKGLASLQSGCRKSRVSGVVLSSIQTPSSRVVFVANLTSVDDVVTTFA